MIVYNQTSTSKRYVSGMLMFFLIAPAIWLFTLGYIFYGIVLIIIYLAFETSRTGVDFDESKFTGFREVLFFIKIRQGESNNLDSFSHYRVKQQNDEVTVSANWAQSSTVSQEHYTLELFDKHKGEFLQLVKSDVSQIQPILIELEKQNIVLKT